MRKTISWFDEAFAARLKGLDGVDEVTTLKLLQADFIRMAAAHPELHWLMSHEAGRGGERLDWLLANLLGGAAKLFTSLIAAAQKAESYVRGDPYHLHYLFLGAAARIFMLAREAEKVMGCSPFDATFVESHVDLCHALFFRDPPATTKARR